MARLTDEDERRLEAVFDRHLDVGLHHGAQLAVYIDGDLAIDLAGGSTGPDPDAAATTPETRFLLFSCTKPYAGVCVHQLAENGDLAYDDYESLAADLESGELHPADAKGALADRLNELMAPGREVLRELNEG